MQVPFLDLKAQNQSIWSDLQSAVEQVAKESAFILGPSVERFEKHFAEWVGVKHAIGLDNGTSALQLALIAAGVGPGDEVITTPHSWVSTTWAISYVGAKPVYVDIDPATYNLDPSKIARAITPRTKAILPVHLYGQACELAPMLDIAAAKGLTLIEDSAQAHGAKYAGKRVGGIGAMGCFSFYPGKNLGAWGEAGALVTNDDAIAERVKRLRDHAQSGRHNHVEVGFNMRMEGIQGAVLDVKLRHLDAWTAARQAHAKRYQELLSGTPNVILPAVPRPEGHVFHLFVVQLRNKDRAEVQRALSERGVQSGIHYPTPIPYQPAYAALGHKPGDFPVADEVMRSCISLPMFAELTNEQIEHVATSLKEVTRS